MSNAFCTLLKVELPIVLAPFGPWDQVELAAAVSKAGGLGSVGTALRTVPELQAQWDRLATLTDRPFAVNHTGRPLDMAAFEATLDWQPAAISFHMGIPVDLIDRAHERGILWIQTVGDVDAAQAALDAGADVLVAQGTEAGGNAGWITTMVLLPPVVDLSGDTPVLAAGGIADGRGIAAALALGAHGVVLGTRFLATREMTIDPVWKARILAAHARDAVKVTGAERLLPPFNLPQIGAPFAPRVLRTPLSDRLAENREPLDSDVVAHVIAEVRAGRGHNEVPFTGQSAELVHDIPRADELIARLVRETGEALDTAGTRAPAP